MNNKLKVSFIVSVFNSSHLIQNSMQSLINQTYKNIEILIIDDGSTDKSYKILKSIEASNSNVKLFKNKVNLGLTKSLNKLIDHCEGEIIARHDIDDFSKPKRIEKQVHEINKFDLDFCLTRARRLDNNKLIPKYSFLLPDKFVMKYKNPFIHGTLAVKKEVLLAVGKYNKKFYYAQDYKLFSDMISQNFKYKVINEPLYYLNMIDNLSSKYKSDQQYFANCVRKNLIP